jgi:hypothetical protein
MRENSFYKRVRPADAGALCEELSAAFSAIHSIDGIHISAMGYANIKAPEFVCILNGPPSPGGLAAAKMACRGYPHVTFVSDGIGCSKHWSELDWADSMLPENNNASHPIIRRLRSLLRRR